MSIGIYKFQNLITLEVYIGQSINLEERYKRHQRDYLQGNTKFYKAIQEYGWNNFSYEVIEKCTQEELNEKEIFWIKYYDSFHNGYNSTKGGSNKNSVNHDIIYNLWKKNKLSPKEISEELKIGLTTVYNSLNGHLDFYEREINNNIIYQYDLNGNFISSWNSRKEAERKLGIASQSIGKVISGERNSAGGFQWKDKYYLKIAPAKRTFQEKQIHQYDLNNNYLKTFKTVKDAGDEIHGNYSLISRVAKKGLSHSAYGYRWSYKKI